MDVPTGSAGPGCVPAMNPRALWYWLAVATALFACIFFYQRHVHHGPSAPARILPNLKPAAVTGIQIRPEGQLEIRAERTNAVWQLTQPIAYPAHSARIESLLTALERLRPATFITRRELRERPKAEEEY